MIRVVSKVDQPIKRSSSYARLMIEANDGRKEGSAAGKSKRRH